jgi:2,3-bisphosphoglycerate-dependent phosphoglycerate mutase
MRPSGGESWEDGHKRGVPYVAEQIVPPLQKDENILIAAHGNSLRSIIMK